MEIMKKEQTGKRKEKTTLEKSTFTQRERKTKIQQNRKINETKHAKGQQKDKRTITFIKWTSTIIYTNKKVQLTRSVIITQ